MPTSKEVSSPDYLPKGLPGIFCSPAFVIHEGDREYEKLNDLFAKYGYTVRWSKPGNIYPDDYTNIAVSVIPKKRNSINVYAFRFELPGENSNCWRIPYHG